MTKKTLRNTTFLLVIVGAILLIFLKINESNSTDHSPAIKAIPEDARFIIQSNNFPELLKVLTKQSQIWEQAKGIVPKSGLVRGVNFLDSLVRSNKTAKGLLSNRPLHISAHITGKDDLDYLYLIGFDNKAEVVAAQGVIEQFLPPANQIAERDYDGVKIWEARFVNLPDKPFLFAMRKGILMISFSPILIQSSIRHLGSSKKIGSHVGSFEAIYETAGKNVDATTIFLNHQGFAKYLTTLFDADRVPFVKNSDKLANWSALDVKIKEDRILIGGRTYLGKERMTYLEVFNGQKPVSLGASSVLPEGISSFVGVGVSDFDLLQTRYREFLSQTDRDKAYSQKIQGYNEEYGIDILKIFGKVVDSEISLAYSNITNGKGGWDTYLVMGTKSKSAAKEELIKLVNAKADKSHMPLFKLVREYKLEQKKEFPIYTMPFQYIGKVLLGDLFGAAQAAFFVILDHHVVFGDSQESLIRLVKMYDRGNVLEHNKGFKDFGETISEKSSLLIYSNPSNALDFYKKYLNRDLRLQLDDHETRLRRFQALAVQYINEEDYMYCNAVLRYSKEYKIVSKTLWDSRLDSSITFKPQVMLNHVTNEKELLVQDDKNMIYLFSNKGVVLWKKQLEGPILGEVHQIDYYKNNKLQLLFNTRSKMYLIDRLGNFVERYPIVLTSPATAPLTVLDYGNTRDYRIFLACDDKRMLLFAKEGNQIDGWDFSKTEGTVTTPLQHFSVGSKDYLVFADELRPYIVNRRGETRVEPKSYFSKSKNSNFALGRTDGKFCLVTSNSFGDVVRLYLEDGAVEKQELVKRTEKHFFEYVDLDGDTYNDYVFVEGKRLEAFDQKGTTILTYDFPNDIVLQPNTYMFSGNKVKVGVVDRTGNKVYLVNVDGSLHEGFPLDGNSLFSIAVMEKSIPKLNLLVGTEDHFLCNYLLK